MRPSTSERPPASAFTGPPSSSSRQLGQYSSMGKVAEIDQVADTSQSPPRKTSLELAMSVPLSPSLKDGLLDSLPNDTHQNTAQPDLLIDQEKQETKKTINDSISPKSHLTIGNNLKVDLKSTGNIHKLESNSIPRPLGSSRSRSGLLANNLQDQERRVSAGLLGTLAVTEKIIGSFLFLRFIVPGKRTSS